MLAAKVFFKKTFADIFNNNSGVAKTIVALSMVCNGAAVGVYGTEAPLDNVRTPVTGDAQYKMLDNELSRLAAEQARITTAYRALNDDIQNQVLKQSDDAVAKKTAAAKAQIVQWQTAQKEQSNNFINAVFISQRISEEDAVTLLNKARKADVAGNDFGSGDSWRPFVRYHHECQSQGYDYSVFNNASQSQAQNVVNCEVSFKNAADQERVYKGAGGAVVGGLSLAFLAGIGRKFRNTLPADKEKLRYLENERAARREKKKTGEKTITVKIG